MPSCLGCGAAARSGHEHRRDHGAHAGVTTLVDANVLLDVITERRPVGGLVVRRSSYELRRWVDVAVNPIVYAEISLAFDRIEDLDEALLGFTRLAAAVRRGVPRRTLLRALPTGRGTTAISAARTSTSAPTQPSQGSRSSLATQRDSARTSLGSRSSRRQAAALTAAATRAEDGRSASRPRRAAGQRRPRRAIPPPPPAARAGPRRGPAGARGRRQRSRQDGARRELAAAHDGATGAVRLQPGDDVPVLLLGRLRRALLRAGLSDASGALADPGGGDGGAAARAAARRAGRDVRSRPAANLARCAERLPDPRQRPSRDQAVVVKPATRTSRSRHRSSFARRFADVVAVRAASAAGRPPAPPSPATAA